MGYLISVAVFVVVMAGFWMHSRERQARIQARAELNRQLLDKFASAQELTAFLQGEAGQRFLDGMDLGRHKKHGSKESILSIITPACVLTAVGVLFVAAGLDVPGLVILAVGIGLFVAAAISYALSKKWGLMNGDSSVSEGPQ